MGLAKSFSIIHCQIFDDLLSLSSSSYFDSETSLYVRIYPIKVILKITTELYS